MEIIFGRGAFTDNFPLFGYNLEDYDAPFMEKVGLFEELNTMERVTWSGRFRSSLDNAEGVSSAAVHSRSATKYWRYTRRPA